jgi:two-component system response regulator AtoC
MLDADDFDFILCDIKMPGMDGLEFLNALKEKEIVQTVIMMSAYASLDIAIECMKRGAYDYVSKPFKADEIIFTLKKAEERERLKKENERLKVLSVAEYDAAHIITKDPVFLEIIELVKKVAGYTTTVLVSGESGTGKELVARGIHDCGPRKDAPFVAVNCGAIPPALLESELFGHVKGAFTDAHRNKTGLFQEAHGGTIFLDEVGELPMELQVKLLRVLQESEIRRLGDTKSIKIDARVVSATVKDLRREAKAGRFRDDLFYRLNVIEMKLPPLRERQGDIMELAAHFSAKYAKKFGKQAKRFSKEATEAMMAYSWPGNVRELENAVERAMILEDAGVIRAQSIPISIAAYAPMPTGPEPSLLPSGEISIKKAEETLEKELIKKALEMTNNNKTKAALLLEISHRALLYKIKSFGL